MPVSPFFAEERVLCGRNGVFSIRNHRFSKGGLVADEFFEWKPLGLGASMPPTRLVAAQQRGSAVKTMQTRVPGQHQRGHREAVPQVRFFGHHRRLRRGRGALRLQALLPKLGPRHRRHFHGRCHKFVPSGTQTTSQKARQGLGQAPLPHLGASTFFARFCIVFKALPVLSPSGSVHREARWPPTSPHRTASPYPRVDDDHITPNAEQRPCFL